MPLSLQDRSTVRANARSSGQFISPEIMVFTGSLVVRRTTAFGFPIFAEIYLSNTEIRSRECTPLIVKNR